MPPNWNLNDITINDLPLSAIQEYIPQGTIVPDEMYGRNEAATDSAAGIAGLASLPFLAKAIASQKDTPMQRIANVGSSAPNPNIDMENVPMESISWDRLLDQFNQQNLPMRYQGEQPDYPGRLWAYQNAYGPLDYVDGPFAYTAEDPNNPTSAEFNRRMSRISPMPKGRYAQFVNDPSLVEGEFDFPWQSQHSSAMLLPGENGGVNALAYSSVLPYQENTDVPYNSTQQRMINEIVSPEMEQPSSLTGNAFRNGQHFFQPGEQETSIVDRMNQPVNRFASAANLPVKYDIYAPGSAGTLGAPMPEGQRLINNILDLDLGYMTELQDMQQEQPLSIDNLRTFLDETDSPSRPRNYTRNRFGDKIYGPPPATESVSNANNVNRPQRLSQMTLDDLLPTDQRLFDPAETQRSAERWQRMTEQAEQLQRRVEQMRARQLARRVGNASGQILGRAFPILGAIDLIRQIYDTSQMYNDMRQYRPEA